MDIPRIYRPERKFFSGRTSEILVEDGEASVVPRDAEAEAKLIKMHRLLQVLSRQDPPPPAILPKTALNMHSKRGLHFLRYPFIPGVTLEEFLTEASSKRVETIAKSLGRFIAWLHALPCAIAQEVPLEFGKDEGKSYEVGEHPLVIMHNDMHGLNVVVTPQDGLSVLDFANACYGDPAADFRKLFGRKSTQGPFAEQALQSYFEASTGMDRDDFMKRLDLHVQAFKEFREAKARKRNVPLVH